MKCIGFGGWIYYYYFLISSSIAKLLKDDIIGFGKTFQIFNELVISKHKFMILFLNYFSEFFFGIIIYLILKFCERKQSKRKKEYENSESNLFKENKDKDKDKHNIKKKKSSKQEMKIISKENNNKVGEKNNDNDLLLEGLNSKLINDNNESSDINLSYLTKKSNNINNSKSFDNSESYPKQYELIHTNLYEEITESSYKYIILSSLLLIINDVIMKWIFSLNEIFDYFFFNILIMTLIFKYHFKEKIYSHQMLALVIVLFLSGALFVACLFEDANFKKENKTVWEAFDGSHYMILVFIVIYLFSSTCSCYGIIIQKRIMDNKFIYPYKIIFCKGILGIIISSALIVISTLVPCKENHIVNIKESKFLNFNSNIYVSENFLIKNNSTENDTGNFNFTETPLFECIDSYNNNTYFDNFFSYFENLNNITNDEKQKDKYLELFLYIPIYSILHFITNILLIFVNKLLSPIHCLIVESLYRIIHIFIQTLQNIDIKNEVEGFFYEFILQPFSTKILRFIAYIISLLGYSIYLEIIELKFCGLNNNIRKNIRKRAISDGRAREKMNSYSQASSSFVTEDIEEDEISKKSKSSYQN